MAHATVRNVAAALAGSEFVARLDADDLASIRFAGQHARLRDRRDEVLRKIDRQYHTDPVYRHSPDKVSAMAYYAVAVLAILALERPRMPGGHSDPRALPRPPAWQPNLPEWSPGN